MKCLPSILLFSTLALAAANGATPTTIPRTRPSVPRLAPAGERFLFVVDISFAMRASESANRQALFDLIFTGLEGQMRTGDSFGLWLFNDALHAQEFPMQVWEEPKALDVASLATKFLREQKYSGKCQPGVMMQRLLKLIKTVRDVNVMILSDGAALKGTPFDANIAAVYERRKAERSKAQKPFITALVARGGAIVSGAVVLAGESVELPVRPAPALAAKGTNSLAAPTSPAPAIAAEPRVTQPNPSARPEAGEPQTTVSLTPQPATPPVPKVIRILTHSNAPPRNASVTASAPANPLAAGVPPPLSPSVAPAPAPPPAAQTALPDLLRPEPLPIAARGFSPPIPADARPVSPAPQAAADAATPPQPAVTAVAAPPSGTISAVLLAIGGGLLAGCLWLLALVLRRSRSPAPVSIITRSMDPR